MAAICQIEASYVERTKTLLSRSIESIVGVTSVALSGS